MIYERIGGEKIWETYLGIEDAVVDVNAPAVYYNLQGLEVKGDLTPGLYIRRQGNTASKVLVK